MTEIISDHPANDDQIIPANEVLPSHIQLMAIPNRPIFPHVMFSRVYPKKDFEKELGHYKNEKSATIGFIMPQVEAEHLDPENIHQIIGRMGTVAKIVNISEAPDDHIQVVFQGLRRFKSLNVYHQNGRIYADVYYPEVKSKGTEDELKALTIAIINSLKELVKHNPIFKEEIRLFLSHNNLDDPNVLADFAINMTTADRVELQEILETKNIKPRLEKVLFHLRKELDLNELKEKMTRQIEEKISKQQRDFFLREQLKAIKEELGMEKDDKTEYIEELNEKLKKLTLSEEAEKVVAREVDKLKILNEQSPEYALCRNYLDQITSLPWGIESQDNLDVKRARVVLDEHHFGLKDVKERILEFMAVAQLKGTISGSIMCLVGPPGVGKTSLGQSVAQALGRKFFRFSLGGMRDEAEIKGHRRTYIGAMMGKILQAIKSCETQNPVILLDELDKVGASYQGDPASALLEVLDPEQNNNFRDHYLDLGFDLSKVLFIATANVTDTIPAALFDRMEVIELSGYTLEEKERIAEDHLIPKLLPKNGLTPKDIAFTPATVRKIISDYAREAGVRGLEKVLAQCTRKIAAKVATSRKHKKYQVTQKMLVELLGQARFTNGALRKIQTKGVVMGLAWTAVGGKTLYIESLLTHNKNEIKITGQLGDIMQESANLAISYIKANAGKFGLNPELIAKSGIHIHVPEGATPKDGPSAGITLASSLISAFLAKPVAKNFAMTGELTLTGLVLPIGGVKEKLLAAKRNKVKNIIFPAENKKDVDELSKDLHEGLTLYFVERYQEVFELLF
ncbi:MAG: endopeptidase La [Lentisphaeria bacterium]|nr:endopeptidase La [Lentisphaeria bacterium]